MGSRPIGDTQVSNPLCVHVRSRSGCRDALVKPVARGVTPLVSIWSRGGATRGLATGGTAHTAVARILLNPYKPFFELCVRRPP